MPRIYRSLLLLSLLFCLQSARAQDPVYSQFYAAPILLNPALTGAYEGNFRVFGIYRNQWAQPLENPFKSFSAGIDLRFELNPRKRVHDIVAGGLYFSSDRVGPYSLSNTSIGLSGAYHKTLSSANKEVLSAGFQFGLTQRNINYEQVTFEDQFNGTSGYVFATNEDLPINNFAFGDIAVGVHYSKAPKRDHGFFIGASLLHINRPELSFYKRDDDQKQQDKSSSRLAMRINATGGVRIYVNEDLTVIPRAMMAFQGPHMYGNIGSTVRLELPVINNNALHLGAYLMPGFGAEKSFSMEAIGLQVGLEIQHLLIGLSYDHSLTDIIDYRTGQGAFELSISYFGNYENEGDDICPTF